MSQNEYLGVVVDAMLRMSCSRTVEILSTGQYGYGSLEVALRWLSRGTRVLCDGKCSDSDAGLLSGYTRKLICCGEQFSNAGWCAKHAEFDDCALPGDECQRRDDAVTGDGSVDSGELGFISSAEKKDDVKIVSSRGLNYERNKKNREEKKKRKQQRRIQQGKLKIDEVIEEVHEPVKDKIVGSLDHLLVPVPIGVEAEKKEKEIKKKNCCSFGGEKTELQLSLEAKWKAENELALERARRQLAVLKANEIDAEVKRYGTNVRVATEKNMVAIEKSHSFLKSTDNVPRSDVDHDVHTVVDSVPGLTEGCTISPDSSASQADFRKCQKDLLDSEERNRRFEAAFQKMGISLEAYEMKDKSEWTDTPENHAILDELYPYGYGEEYEYTKVKGKFNAIPCTDLSY